MLSTIYHQPALNRLSHHQSKVLYWARVNVRKDMCRRWTNIAKPWIHKYMYTWIKSMLPPFKLFYVLEHRKLKKMYKILSEGRRHKNNEDLQMFPFTRIMFLVFMRIFFKTTTLTLFILYVPVCTIIFICRGM